MYFPGYSCISDFEIISLELDIKNHLILCFWNCFSFRLFLRTILQVFWLGNLKNRDLQGNEIQSQADPTSQASVHFSSHSNLLLSVFIVT